MATRNPMKISVPQATVGTARVQQVDVGQVRLGPAHVGLLSLNGLKLQASTGVAQMRNVRVVLDLKFSLDWTVGVVIDAGPFGTLDLSQSGVLDLGALELRVGFGDLTLPGLADLTLDIPRLPVPDVSAVIGALKDLRLGPIVAERIAARGVVAPARAFELDGLGLGGVSARGIAVPDAAVEGATIRRVSGGSVPLSGLRIPNLALPPVKVPRLSTGGIGAASNPLVTAMPEADVGLLKAALNVTTTARFDIDELRLDGIRAAATIGEIALKDVELPFEILDLSLSQIGIERIAVPTAELN